MKNRTGKIAKHSEPIIQAPIDLDEVLEKLEIAKTINETLLKRIDSLVMRIASIEKSVEIANTMPEQDWNFDVIRDHTGRIIEVRANKSKGMQTH
jgi:hypothetical protein